MIAVEIENIKRFMAGFLGGDLFDDFLMNEGKLSMDIAYEFNGKVLKEFYDTEEWEKYGTYPDKPGDAGIHPSKTHEAAGSIPFQTQAPIRPANHCELTSSFRPPHSQFIIVFAEPRPNSC